MILKIQFYKKIKFLFDNYYHIKYMRIEQYNNLIIQIDNLWVCPWKLKLYFFIYLLAYLSRSNLKDNKSF